ncbi:MAG: hypothetical protein A2010_16010 [Nitrospirae bacterium GWD2_57_9]|nr:MAG: hypothetical protein A2010_16010 [Nitrospirae bacterium GWD2_57_9]OGW45402.1 MAG: hypothetical protein A2078_00080 [Nitrospirae bacterium GWC2_57_9]
MKSLVLMICFLFLSGCVYTHVTMPLSTELNKTQLGSKQGDSSMYSLLWLFAWGDGGAAAAAKKGGITVMTHMDREFESILFGLYTRTTTVVHGD